MPRPQPRTSRRYLAAFVVLAIPVLAPSPCSDPLSLERTLLAKAQPDECYAGLGQPYPAGPPCPAGSQPKVNQAYVFGLTDSHDRLWFGTSANQLCTVLGTVVDTLAGAGLPIDLAGDNGAWVCEYGQSDFRNVFEPIPSAGFDTLPATLGDWRPPKIYSYDLDTGELVDRTPDDELIDNTLGIRSAGAIGELAILAGPNLEAGFLAEGGAINLFAFNTVTGAYLGSTSISDYTDIRKWVVVNGVLYTGVRGLEDGRVLRWNGTVADPFQYEEVGRLDAEAVELAAHEGRLFVTTWWLQLGDQMAGLWMSPEIPDGGLTNDDLEGWTKVWAADDYEPDEAVAYSYYGSALASFDGYLYWGTINFPIVSLGAHVLLRDILNTNPLDILPALGASYRSVAVFRGRNFASSPEMETLYGEEELFAYNGTTWSLQPTGMGPPLYGHSGFGNPFNAYIWNMVIGADGLYVGTMDWSFMLDQFVRSLALTLGVPDEDVLDQLPPAPTGGADLYRFPDADTAAVPESLTGVGNQANYGVRTSVALGDDLYLGTANAMNLLTDPDDALPDGGWELLKLSPRTGLGGAPVVVGDVDDDGVVGPNDVDLVISAIGQDASGPYDPRDANQDGVIDEGDVAQVALLCTTCSGTTWLVASHPAPAPVGQTVLWTAIDGGEYPTAKRYRFVVTPPGGEPMIARDFDVLNFFDWTPLEDGDWEVSVEVRNDALVETRGASRPYSVASRLSDDAPAVNPTRNPLVALYSAPPCEAGKSVRVHYRMDSSQSWSSTPPKACLGEDHSVNFLVAGLRVETTYQMRHQVDGLAASAPLSHETGAPLLGFPDFEVLQGPEPSASLEDGVVLQAMIIGGPQLLACPAATDLAGNLIWHYPAPCLLWNVGSMMPRPVPGGGMLLAMSRFFTRGQVLREIDLAGHTIRETNVERINEQLDDLGEDRITLFHHEARRLANGHTLVLTGVEKMVDQGDGVEDVIGDMVIDLDPDWQVAWVWNSFEHLDVTRKALLDETCGGSGILGVCGPLELADDANDWTHSNAITYLPDGNLLVSMRHQDWVIKIDYADGTGSGDVLWRLGADGDFTLEQAGTPDPAPWFSHQHQPELYGSELVIYDNSNLRHESDENAHSRGQSYLIDEDTMTATLILNADLGVYSSFLGSAQKLANGNYHFLSGGIGGGTDVGTDLGIPAGDSQSTEVTPDGEIVYVLATGATTYRSFRMPNLYGVAEPMKPMEGCRQTDRQALKLKTKKGKLAWKWNKGAETVAADFGEPMEGTDYRLCIFDHAGAETTAVFCEELGWGPSWEPTSKGFRYKDKIAPDDLRKLKLREGPDGRAAIRMKGKGVDLPALPLAADPGVTVQLSNQTTGVCWESVLTDVRRNDAKGFKAK